ncbi:MAG: hypothetical protein NC489_31590 [Ruminococcus flavefaciens]|nr:hypothetical protein [Ruminococcus flavefaciens]
MKLGKGKTVFDLLAILCSMLTKEEERKCSIEWAVAGEKYICDFINEYKNFLAVILNASANEYKFTDDETSYLNNELVRIKKACKRNKEDIYRLAIEVEKRIDMYSKWQNHGVIYRLEPLNANYKKTGIAVYPHIMPQWNMKKSERNRERKWNTIFTNYMIIRAGDISPFEIIMHYWNDTGLLRKTKDGWELRIALSPIMDDAMLETEEQESASGCTVRVKGIKNEQIVEERTLRIFDALFPKGYGMIVFPEILGSESILQKIKDRMKEYPERCSFVAVPTICRDGRNTLVVLGPGGIECLRQEKTTPAILITKEGKMKREDLVYGNQVHLLITRELGLMAFPICAELLDPVYYRLLVDTALADTIICSSFSPGVVAFRDTLMKGIPAKLLGVYINSCSAKAVSRKGEVAEPLGIIQVPNSEDGYCIRDIERECQGRCTGEICYFDILITYKDEKFLVVDVHRRCA